MNVDNNLFNSDEEARRTIFFFYAYYFIFSSVYTIIFFFYQNSMKILLVICGSSNGFQRKLYRTTRMNFEARTSMGAFAASLEMTDFASVTRRRDESPTHHDK